MPRMTGFIVVLLSVILLSSTATAGDTLRVKIDSMFIIASSGDFKFREMVEPTLDDMAALGESAVPYLIEKLNTRDARERVTLRRILEKIGKPAVPFLNEALLADDSLKVARVALVLTYIPDESSIENLIRVADDNFYWIRYQAVRALGKIEDIRARPAIEKAFEDSNELVRTMAAVAAGRLDPREFIDRLGEALADDYYGVRLTALEELKKLDCDAKRKLLLPILRETKDNMTRKLILSALSQSFCAYEFDIFQPFLIYNDPIISALALKTVYQLAPDTILKYISDMTVPIGNLYLQQTIDEIKAAHEK